MTLIFYLLYVWSTPARWSWLWFLIALVIVFVDNWFKLLQTLGDDEDHTNYWKGPYA